MITSVNWASTRERRLNYSWIFQRENLTQYIAINILCNYISISSYLYQSISVYERNPMGNRLGRRYRNKQSQATQSKININSTPKYILI